MRLGVSITLLLFQKCADGRPAMMPHNRRGRKRDLLAGNNQLPANIHVVARPRDASDQSFRFAPAPIFETPYCIPAHARLIHYPTVHASDFPANSSRTAE